MNEEHHYGSQATGQSLDTSIMLRCGVEGCCTMVRAGFSRRGLFLRCFGLGSGDGGPG